MGIRSWIKTTLAKRELAAARRGDRGGGLAAMLKAMDGYKRILMILIFAGGAVASTLTGQSYDHVVRSILGILGWDPADAVVSATIVAQLVGAAWSVWDGIRKARQNKP